MISNKMNRMNPCSRYLEKITSLTLIVSLCFGMFMSYPVGTSYATIPDDDFFTIDENGEITHFDSSDFEHLEIPKTINGITVKSIGERAFENRKITSIVIPSGVTSIGDRAFTKNNLTSVTIPDKVKSIGVSAFMFNNLTLVDIPDSIVSIGDAAFYQNRLTSVTISNSVTSIGDAVFQDNNLTSVDIPDSVTSIGNNAFEKNRLTFITIPETVTSIGDAAFQENDLTTVTIPKNVTTIGNNAFANNQDSPEDLIIIGQADSVAETYANENNHTFELVEAEAVKADKTKLTDDAIKNDNSDLNNVTSDLKLLSNGSNGTTISWSSTNTDVVSNDGKVTRPDNEKGDATVTLTATISKGDASDTKTFTVTVLKKEQATAVESFFTIEENTGTITDYDPAGGTDVIIPNSINGIRVLSIGDKAFRKKGLTSVEIPDGVTSIGDDTFRENNLASVDIPESVTSIGNYAFLKNKLESVTILDSVTSIGNYSFSENQLTSITISNSLLDISGGAFNRNKLKSVTIPANVTHIGPSAFSDNQLETLEIPKNVIRIGDKAFSNNLLTSLVIPDNVRFIVRDAFINNKLTVVEIHGKTTIIQDNPFSNNQNNPIDLTIRGYKNVEDYAKKYNYTFKLLQKDSEAVDAAKEALTADKIRNTNPDLNNVTSDLNLLNNGNNNTMITWSSSNTDVVTNDGNVIRPAYEEGNATVTLTATISKGNESETKQFSIKVLKMETKEYYVFDKNSGRITDYNPAGGTDVVIPDSIDGVTVNSIGLGAFKEKGLTSVKIPDSVTIITDTAFQDNDLASVSLGKSVMFIGGNAFAGNELTSVVIPDSVVSISNEAFANNQKNPLDLIIIGIKDSDAQRYAADHNHTFQLVQTDNEAVDDALEALTADSIKDSNGKTIDLEKVASDLVLPKTGANGTAITWSSSNPDVVSNDGKVSRPEYEKGDIGVTLTATISKREAQTTKEFTITVLKKEQSGSSETRGDDGNDNNETSPSSTSENIEVSVEGNDGTNLTKTPINRTTELDGNVKYEVTMSDDIAKEAVEKAKEQNIDTARIVIPDTEEAETEVVIEIPQTAIKQLNKGNMKLEVATDNALISVPTTSIFDFEKDLYFRVIPIKSEEEQTQVEERAKKEEIIQTVAKDQSVKVLGVPMEIETNMENREVSIILPLKDSLPNDPDEKQKILDNLGVFIEHSDGTKELLQGNLILMKDGSEGIEFTVTKFSTFILLYLEGWETFNQSAQHTQLPYIKGFGDEFRPDAFVTRAEMAKMLATYLTVNEDAEEQDVFTDVSKTHWANSEIQKVKETGIMIGTSDSTFDPEGIITRAQMASISYKWIEKKCLKDSESHEYCDCFSSGFTKATFKDVAKDHWASQVIDFMNNTNIMIGYEDNTFRPNEKLTRAQAVKVLNKLFKQ